MTNEFGHCWSCLLDLDRDTAVWITDELHIQCCRTCWATIPAAQRLLIAHRLKLGPVTESAIEALALSLQRSLNTGNFDIEDFGRN